MTLAAFGSATNRMCIRFRKKFMICSRNLLFCVVISVWSNWIELNLLSQQWNIFYISLYQTKPLQVLQRQKAFQKTKKLDPRMKQEKAIWEPGIDEITKTSTPNISPQQHGANVVTHVRLWPIAVKINLSWKTEVSKSAWIKPWGDRYLCIYLVVFFPDWLKSYEILSSFT